MRKTDLNAEQAAERQALIQILAEGGWKGTQRHESFEAGVSNKFQLDMTRTALGMEVLVKLNIEKRILKFHFLTGGGGGLEFEFEYGDKLLDLARELVASRDALTTATYKPVLSKLRAICPALYMWVDEERVPVVSG